MNLYVPLLTSLSSLLIIKIVMRLYYECSFTALANFLGHIYQTVAGVYIQRVQVTGCAKYANTSQNLSCALLIKPSKTVMTWWTTPLSKLIGHNYRLLQVISHCQVVITEE